jgi:ABC-type histidine transport system ATPase subunit
MENRNSTSLLIDNDLNYLENMPEFLRSQNFDSSNYHIISIIGEKSSGKSTFLD